MLAAICYPYVVAPGSAAPRPGAQARRRRARRRCSPRTSGSATTAATSRDGRSNAPGTASTSSATTAPSATCSATGCSRSNGRTLTPRHGYEMPESVAEAGQQAPFDDALARSAALYDALVDDFPVQAPYAVSLAYRMRYSMQMNAREAMHVLELRSSPQGHPVVPAHRAGDAPAHRRTSRTPRDRASDASRRSRDLRARAPRLRARGGSEDARSPAADAHARVTHASTKPSSSCGARGRSTRLARRREHGAKKLKISRARRDLQRRASLQVSATCVGLTHARL